MSMRTIHAGFIPLVDCAPLVMVRELGMDKEHDFQLKLIREVSWANIRDKVEVGMFDCAHMLAPMPLASSLGLVGASEPVVTPLALSLNGNAITMSQQLLGDLRSAAEEIGVVPRGMDAARALKRVVDCRQQHGRELLTFGMVYPFSSHNFDLRCWLASAGIDPDNDVNLIVVPPPLLSESLKASRVDGFCVGAPWSSVAVAEGSGAIVATKNDLWPASPEKVLGVREAWASQNKELLNALLAALIKAGRWLDETANRAEAAKILARPEYVGASQDLIEQPLSGRMASGGGQTEIAKDRILFSRESANMPWRSHAIWFLTQMVRWGQIRKPFDLQAIAQRVYRPDLYREVASGLDEAVPETDFRTEEANQFFGGEHFDPHQPLAYLAETPIKSASTDLAGFSALNS